MSDEEIIKILKAALKKIEDGPHDEHCESNGDTRDDCMAAHSCDCAARVARKALYEIK